MTCTQNPLYPLSNFVSYSALSSSYQSFVSSLGSVSIPNTWQEAMKYKHWHDVMLEKMSALKKNQTWELINLPSGKKSVGCRWIFTVKQNADGTIDRYKARLVARSFTQTQGIDYQETFALVAKRIQFGFLFHVL